MSKEIEENYGYCKETLTFKGKLEEGYLILAKRLKKIRDERLFAQGWEYFADFLEEMHMSEATASKMIQIYEKFVLGWGFNSEDLLKAGGWSSIAETLPVVHSRADAEDALLQAGTLTRADLRRYVTEKKSGKPMELCLHAESYNINICKTCGERRAI